MEISSRIKRIKVHIRAQLQVRQNQIIEDLSFRISYRLEGEALATGTGGSSGAAVLCSVFHRCFHNCHVLIITCLWFFQFQCFWGQRCFFNSLSQALVPFPEPAPAGSGAFSSIRGFFKNSGGRFDQRFKTVRYKPSHRPAHRLYTALRRLFHSATPNPASGRAARVKIRAYAAVGSPALGGSIATGGVLLNASSSPKWSKSK